MAEVLVGPASELALVSAFVERARTGGILAASRPGEESFVERAGLPRCELGPLEEQAANTLVGSRFPDLAPRVRQRVVTEAADVSEHYGA